ncbi:GPW/gp25 family protein [Sorangium sp. So ce1389]|uniref:GPW/gp25 family protein n=1 Tax=Sorangium sp. So ce1389 TaxID=3133336 RepID=UPI003F62C5B0
MATTRALAAHPIGFPLLPVPDAHGELRYPGLEESVRQSIQVLLRTRPGEHLMHPEFGAGLDAFLHQPNTLSTRREIRDRIRDALLRWEPRIELGLVEVREIEGSPAAVRAEISYRLRRTGAEGRVGLTMELGA